ncbi:hypothetical protein E2C01_102783 [Portunus trituberculatus]|uniref:Uncharacterized protein n=1 Tax=Portunus trituberculatus TaxID=210409 RepID=A0A5B7KPY1_PORTR|nr:hypothetical protein [Portunus trituberculatus]
MVWCCIITRVATRRCSGTATPAATTGSKKRIKLINMSVVTISRSFWTRGSYNLSSGGNSAAAVAPENKPVGRLCYQEVNAAAALNIIDTSNLP